MVKEVAEAINKYNRIDFLDDNSEIVIGKYDEYMSFRDDYTYAFVAFGSNKLRSKGTEKLREAGFEIPTLTSHSLCQFNC